MEILKKSESEITDEGNQLSDTKWKVLLAYEMGVGNLRRYFFYKTYLYFYHEKIILTNRDSRILYN